jgi:hypothetical protein
MIKKDLDFSQITPAGKELNWYACCCFVFKIYFKLNMLNFSKYVYTNKHTQYILNIGMIHKKGKSYHHQILYFFYQEENPFAALTFYWEPLLRSVKRKFTHKNLKYSKS